MRARSGGWDNAQKRFEREAQAIARLRSPHTVTLFDFGVADDGAFYYVMELLDGLDADTLVKRFGPLPAERVVYLLRQMCHSLSEAHSCGLVHRDIKPANVFLCRYGEDHDFVKILDFGIAKAAHESSDTQTALTAANLIQGTPAFIAPEQVLGGTDVDARADIYSAGCVAFWLLTGEQVFTGDTTMQLLLAHAQTVPDAPSSRTELPIAPELDALVLSCLAKDRALRPASAQDLLKRLEPWRSTVHGPTSARQNGGGSTCREHPRLEWLVRRSDRHIGTVGHDGYISTRGTRGTPGDLTRAGALLTALLLVFVIGSAATAGVVRVEIQKRIDDGRYERLIARVYLVVDPMLPANRAVADLALAPRNAAGLVEFSSDLVLSGPKTRGGRMAQCSSKSSIAVATSRWA